MTECYCDWDPPSVYRKTEHTARRKTRKCSECGATVGLGERYQLTFGVWDRVADSFTTCARCLALEDWVRAHVPCLCLEHGNLIENCLETASDCRQDAPGLWFGTLRRLHAIRRARGLTSSPDRRHAG